MAEDVNSFIEKWKKLVQDIKTQALHKEHCDTVRLRFRKEKMQLLAETEQEVSIGAILDDIEKELESALTDAEALHSQKKNKNFLLKLLDGFMEWVYRMMHGKL